MLIRRLDEPAARTVADHIGYGPFAWAPTSDRLAYASGCLVKTVGLDGTPLATFPLLWKVGVPLGVAWVPNGATIAFTSARGLYTLDLTTGDVTELVDSDIPYPRDPAWSSDGARLAYSAGHPAEVFVIDAAGANLASSPDGTTIAYFAERWPWSDVGDVWLVPTEGGVARPPARSRAGCRAPR